jgi:hypothetical protein
VLVGEQRLWIVVVVEDDSQNEIHLGHGGQEDLTRLQLLSKLFSFGFFTRPLYLNDCSSGKKGD